MKLTPERVFAIGFIGFCVLILIVLVIAPDAPRDDSDPSYGPRSQMAVRTDALTGCQYLEGWSLTPRLDARGQQVGCRQ